MVFRFLLGLPVLLTLAVACGRPADSADHAPSVASLHASKCGSCHVPVEPGTRSRSHLETAFARHESQHRVKLTAEQWDAMVEYLAPK